MCLSCIPSPGAFSGTVLLQLAPSYPASSFPLSPLDHCGQHTHVLKYHLLWKNTFLDHISFSTHLLTQPQFLWFSSLVPEKRKQAMWPAHYIVFRPQMFLWSLKKSIGPMLCLTRMQSSFYLGRKAGLDILPWLNFSEFLVTSLRTWNRDKTWLCMNYMYIF